MKPLDCSLFSASYKASQNKNSSWTLSSLYVQVRLRSSEPCSLPLVEPTWVQLVDLSLNMTKSTKWHVRPAKTQISLGIRPAWSESSLSALRKLGSLDTRWAHSEDSDQTGRILGAQSLCWFCHVAAHLLFWCILFSPHRYFTTVFILDLYVFMMIC